MSIEFEAYTAEGLLTGRVVADGRLIDMLMNLTAIAVEGAALTPVDGLRRRADTSTVQVDDLLAVIAPVGAVTPFHAAWHGLTVTAGPYLFRGELPSLPGYDPARSLARPSGSFVLVGRVQVEWHGAGPASALSQHNYVWLNRYAVDAVYSDLELGAFFPGARAGASRQAIAG